MNITDPLDKQKNFGETEVESDDAGNNAKSSKIPRANECFFGLYVDLMPVDKDAQKFLANDASYVGMELCLKNKPSDIQSADADSNLASTSSLWIEAKNGNPIAKVPDEYAQKLFALMSENWDIFALLSMVTYSKKEGKFFAEIAFMCISPNCDEATNCSLHKFIDHQTRRIKGGDHPTISLGQKQFEKVIETGGEWYMTKIAKLSDDQKKRMSYKKSQSLTGKIVDTSLSHQKGCAAASTIILLIMAGLIIWGVTKLFGL